MKFKRNLSLKCNPSDIWKALTQAEHYAKYMFGAEVESDWKVGGPVSFYMAQDGNRVKIIEGKVEKVEENKLLRHSLFPLNAKYENVMDNHIHVAYRIEEKDDGSCELEIQQDGFETAAEGEKRYEHALMGWDHALPLLKDTILSISN